MTFERKKTRKLGKRDSSIDTYQLPEIRHVGGLPDLSLVGGTVSVTANGAIHGLTRFRLVLGRKGKSGTHGHLRTDDSLSSIKVSSLIIKVHGTSLTLGHAFNDAKEFTDNRRD